MSMTTPLLHVEVLDKREMLESIRNEWDTLACEDARDGFFRTAAWYLAWLDHIRPDSKPFVITVRDDNHRLVGLAPLCQIQYRHYGLTFTAVGFGGSDVVCGDYLDVLTTGDRQLIIQTVLDRLWELRSQWSLFIFGDVITGGDLQLTADSWAKNKNMYVHHLYTIPCAYIKLPNQFDNFVKGLSKNLRYQIRRNFRELFENKSCRIETYTEPALVVNHLDILIRLHEARWQRDGQSGVLGQGGFPDFLRQVILSLPQGAQTRLYVLMHQEQPVAAKLVFWFGETAVSYQCGYDPNSSIASFSPGFMVMQQTIKDAIEGGYHYYDFLRGAEDYKSSWTKTSRTITTLILVRSPLASAYFRIIVFMRWFKYLWVKPPVPWTGARTTVK